MAGGALADSVDRRKILLFGQSAAMLITAGLAAVSVLDAREVWRLSAATFLVAVVGSRFVGARPSILALRAMDFGVTFMAGYRAILPVFAKDILGVGPEGLGILTGASGVGAVFGSITIILLGGVRRKGVFVMATTSLFSLVVLGFSASTWFPLSIALTALRGLLDSMSVTTRNTIILITTPDELRGRVQSVVQMVVFGAPSLAGLPIGARAAFIGPQPAPALGGVRCLALVGAVRLRVADLWRIGSGEATPTPPVQH